MKFKNIAIASAVFAASIIGTSVGEGVFNSHTASATTFKPVCAGEFLIGGRDNLTLQFNQCVMVYGTGLHVNSVNFTVKAGYGPTACGIEQFKMWNNSKPTLTISKSSEFGCASEVYGGQKPFSGSIEVNQSIPSAGRWSVTWIGSGDIPSVSGSVTP